MAEELMVQRVEFSNGNFVLHRVMINGHKYSCWYDSEGTPFSAERVSGNRSWNVPARHKEVWKQLERVGKRLAKVQALQ